MTLLNILILILLGALFNRRYKTILFFLIAILIVESTQYYLWLVFFDVGDIVTNMFGFILGNLINDSKLGRKIIIFIKKEV